MSGESISGGDHSFDVNELLEIGARCRELRKEKDMLRDSQGQSYELIRRLEHHVLTLSEAREEDKNHIQNLESELENCSQEIDYLRDQLNLRNKEMNSLSEHLCSLQLKLTNVEIIEEDNARVRDELEISNAECLYLHQKLENKDLELESSALCIEKLEESIASQGLEYQCEIESLKFDLMAMEQNYFEAKKFHEETVQENVMTNKFIGALELRIHDADEVIERLKKENEDLREQLQASEKNIKTFSEKVEEQFRGWLANNDSSSSKKEHKASCCGDILGPLLNKLAVLGPSDVEVMDKMKKMTDQIKNFELLVKQLKEELRMEKLNAKEEAEDLAQEMAELRYQITELLEEERKRRACIEELSLQRIAELEAQIEKERVKSFTEEQSKSINIFRHVSET